MKCALAQLVEHLTLNQGVRVRTPEGAGRNHLFWRQRSSGGGDFLYKNIKYL